MGNLKIRLYYAIEIYTNLIKKIDDYLVNELQFHYPFLLVYIILY